MFLQDPFDYHLITKQFTFFLSLSPSAAVLFATVRPLCFVLPIAEQINELKATTIITIISGAYKLPKMLCSQRSVAKSLVRVWHLARVCAFELPCQEDARRLKRTWQRIIQITNRQKFYQIDRKANNQTNRKMY